MKSTALITVHITCSFFFFNDTATTEIYTLSLHDALPISRGRHPAADDDPLHAQEHDHVAGAYPEVPAGVAETQLGAGISRAGRGHRLLDIGPAASICDGVGAGKRFEAATVAAVAHRAIGVDGLVAELARGAAVAEVQPAAEDQSASDAGAQRDAQHRRRALTGAEAVLGKREGARIVDKTDGHLEGGAHLRDHRHAVPVARDVRDQPRDARGEVDVAG